MTFHTVFTNWPVTGRHLTRNSVWEISGYNARNGFVDPAVLRFADLVPVSLPRDLEPGVESLHLM